MILTSWTILISSSQPELKIGPIQKTCSKINALIAFQVDKKFCWFGRSAGNNTTIEEINSMAKKQKRKVSSNSRSENTRITAGKKSTARSTEFNPDYSHVISDLKRIAILAGSFFIVLIALTFIIN
jgi:hypothetical protein